MINFKLMENNLTVYLAISNSGHLSRRNASIALQNGPCYFQFVVQPAYTDILPKYNTFKKKGRTA